MLRLPPPPRTSGDRVLPGRRRGGPDPRRLRLLALAGLAFAAAVLPLTMASAGQVGESAHGTDRDASPGGRAPAPGGAGTDAGAAVGTGAGAVQPGDAWTGAGPADDGAGGPDEGTAAGSDDGAGAGPDGRAGAGSDDGDKPAGRGGAGADHGSAPAPAPRLLGLGQAIAVRCGPALSSPEGVEAQTCVLARGGDTWARAYYRNTTGDDVDALLSLLGPGGRTVLIHCATGADDEPATCETPPEPAHGIPAAYTAVAEFARQGEDAPLLLRAGSNSTVQNGS